MTTCAPATTLLRSAKMPGCPLPLMCPRITLGPTWPGVGLLSNHEACIGSDTGGTARLPSDCKPVATKRDSAEIEGTDTRVGVENARGAGESTDDEEPEEFIPTITARPTSTITRAMEMFVSDGPER